MFYLDKTSCDLCPISEVESSAAAETEDDESSCGENEMEPSPKRNKKTLPSVPDFNVGPQSTPQPISNSVANLGSPSTPEAQPVSNSLAGLRSRFPLSPEGIIFVCNFLS